MLLLLILTGLSICDKYLTVLPYQDKDSYGHAEKSLENLKLKSLNAYETDQVWNWKAN